MSRVGGMLEALQSVAAFRNDGGAASSSGSERFDIDDPADRRRRFQKAHGKHEQGQGQDQGWVAPDGSRDSKREKKRHKKEKRRRREKELSESSEEDAPRERDRGRKARDAKQDEERSRPKKRRKQSSRRRDSERCSPPAGHCESGSSPVEVVTAILQKFSNVGRDLKVLLQTVDNGQAVDVSGLPNKPLVKMLERLFVSLELNKLRDGVYSRPERSRPTMEILESCFERHAERDTERVNERAISEDGESPEMYGPRLPTPAQTNGPSPVVAPVHDMPERPEKETERMPGASESAGEVTSDKAVPDVRRRVMGPAMPSADMLTAAAKLTAAQAALREAEEELLRDPLVGPAPAAAVAESESVNEAERFEEVTRLMAADVGDAYDVLGVKPDAVASILKKRYWKLSLLVHPDKCAHPQAQEAFMKVNGAFKDLQDPVKRAKIDQIALAKREREEHETELRLQREAAHWRRLRGESPLPGDELVLKQEPSRDEWMTTLPDVRQAHHTYTQTTSFSRFDKSRGDTSGWTDTPLQKAQKAKMQYLEAFQQTASAVAEAAEKTRQQVQSTEVANLVDSYNQRSRPVSLLKKHQQSQADEKKAKKSKNAVKTKSDSDKAWAENHPWKPWDRETDLSAGRKAVNLEPSKLQADSLQNRFGKSETMRSFL